MVQESFYENLFFPDAQLPLIFHHDRITSDMDFMVHWQDSPEILYFTEGRGEVVSDIRKAECRAGDVAWINNGSLHSVRAVTPVCEYDCLIVDRDFLESQGILAADLFLKLCIRDQAMRDCLEQLRKELKEQKPLYHAAVRACLIELGVYASRHYQDSPREATVAQSRRILMVKHAIRYLQEHFTEELTVDQISEAVGFSKYYFCRGFKEVTGRTVMDYLNAIRTSHARHLLISGHFNVSESAQRSGFTNLSYFTRVYKRYMGRLPSQEEDIRKGEG